MGKIIREWLLRFLQIDELESDLYYRTKEDTKREMFCYLDKKLDEFQTDLEKRVGRLYTYDYENWKRYIQSWIQEQLKEYKQKDI